MKKISILIELAKKGADTEPCEITSREIGEKINCSQQTAARWLKKLSEEELIEQEVGSRGQTIKITKKGTNLLKSIKQEIDEALGTHPEFLKLSGKVVSGLGEGSYYVDQEEYKKQLEEKLGFTPYPGTLDLKLSKKSLKLREKLENYQGKRIEGFSTKERSFGEVRCFPAKINHVRAGVVLPNRSHYEDIMEIVAPVNLRDEFDLDDNDELSVEVMI
ncbi:MAG: DUF120 domain-containing protein [Hadesarchaea archaeon]|nr:DUF120 domain-containing protein [Hadesarchaea archaeon]